MFIIKRDKIAQASNVPHLYITIIPHYLGIANYCLEMLVYILSTFLK